MVLTTSRYDWLRAWIGVSKRKNYNSLIRLTPTLHCIISVSSVFRRVCPCSLITAFCILLPSFPEALDHPCGSYLLWTHCWHARWSKKLTSKFVSVSSFRNSLWVNIYSNVCVIKIYIFFTCYEPTMGSNASDLKTLSFKRLP